LYTLITNSRTTTDILQEALKHRWLTGSTATDKDLVQELRSRQVRTRLRLGVSRVQLAKRIEQLQTQADQNDDIPTSPAEAATEAYTSKGASALTRKLKGDIFRAVVLAKAKEMKAQRDAEEALIAANARKS